MEMLETRNLPATALLFHALSDPTRLELVRMLARGERCVCELTGAMGAAQSRLSFHLKTLKSAGLVTDRRDGRWVYYSLNAAALGSIGDFAESVREASLLPEKGCCG